MELAKSLRWDLWGEAYIWPNTRSKVGRAFFMSPHRLCRTTITRALCKRAIIFTLCVVNDNNKCAAQKINESIRKIMSGFSVMFPVHNYTFPRRDLYVMVTYLLCSVYHNKKWASCCPSISPEPLSVLAHYVKVSDGFSTRTYVHHAVWRSLRACTARNVSKVYLFACVRFCVLCTVCHRRSSTRLFRGYAGIEIGACRVKACPYILV